MDDTDFLLHKLNMLAIRKAKRNDPCPCGSGKKYKKCCLQKRRAIEVAMKQRVREELEAEEAAEAKWNKDSDECKWSELGQEEREKFIHDMEVERRMKDET